MLDVGELRDAACIHVAVLTVADQQGLSFAQGEADATWIFLGWEGVDAQIKGVELNAFKLGDYGIPYGYTPLLVALPQFLR